VARIRLDRALVERGLARSRVHARELVASGAVLVGGAPALSPARLVALDEDLRIVATRWRPRGARKLEGVLEQTGLDPSGRVCLDVGASTGGFTMVLLERGAEQVVCVDVGTGQLDTSLREDPRVLVFERTDVRDLVWPLDAPASLVVVDVSFVSLQVVAPALERLAPGAEVLALVKPQFEVGRRIAARYRGVIPEGPERDEAVRGVVEGLARRGWRLEGRYRSTLAGAEGNQEEFLHAWLPGEPREVAR